MAKCVQPPPRRIPELILGQHCPARLRSITRQSARQRATAGHRSRRFASHQPHLFLQRKKLHQDFFLLRAQECYEKARQYLPTPSPSRLQMELDIAQADFCRFNHFASQETRLLNKALDKALQEQDSLMLVRIGLIRSSRFKSKKEFDQALAELRMADRYAASLSIDKQAELQAEMAVVHLYMEQPDSALADIERAIATSAGRQNFYRTFCKGIRFHIARNDSAHYYFRQIAEMYPLSRKTDAYRYMSEALYHRGESLKAFDFLREHVRYRDSLDADKKPNYWTKYTPSANIASNNNRSKEVKAN